MNMIRFFLPLLLLVLSISACGPLRKPVPPGTIPSQPPVSVEDEQFGQQVFAELMDQYRLETDDTLINRVRDVVEHLAATAQAANNPWNVHVFHDDKFKNAAATRGNFIFVWSGLLHTVSNSGELATVLAHEMGHVLANHTAPSPQEETMRVLSGTGGEIAGQIVSTQDPTYGILAGLAKMVVSAALEAAFVNPEQQRKELEADHIGLFLLADAGYDPSAAVAFWDRVKNDPGFSGFPLAFLSTHPSSDERLAQLKALLPQAVERYERGLRRGR